MLWSNWFSVNITSSFISIMSQKCELISRYGTFLCHLDHLLYTSTDLLPPLVLLLPLAIIVTIVFLAVCSFSSPPDPCRQEMLEETNLQIRDLCNSVLQLLAVIMSRLKTGPSIHLSTPMNTLTHKTVAGSSLFHMDMEFISTSPYFRQSLSLITLLSGKSECTHTHLSVHTSTHKKCIRFFSVLAFILGLIASLTGKFWMYL